MDNFRWATLQMNNCHPVTAGECLKGTYFTGFLSKKCDDEKVTVQRSSYSLISTEGYFWRIGRFCHGTMQDMFGLVGSQRSQHVLLNDLWWIVIQFMLVNVAVFSRELAWPDGNRRLPRVRYSFYQIIIKCTARRSNFKWMKVSCVYII